MDNNMKDTMKEMDTEMKELEAEKLKQVAAGVEFPGLLPYNPPRLPRKPDDEHNGGGATGGW